MADYLEFLGARGLGLEELEAARAWVAELHLRGLDPASVCLKLSALRGFYRFLRRRGLVRQDPTALIPSPRRPQRLPHFLTVDEAFRLLDSMRAAPARDRAILEVLYGCGLRVSELVGLNLGDVNPEEAEVRVRGKVIGVIRRYQ